MSKYSQYLKERQWKAVRLRFQFQARSCIRFPPFSGSMLRGVFGRALRSVSCLTKAKDCKGCLLRTNCPYSRLFEPQLTDSIDSAKFSAVPPGYVFEPHSWGAEILNPGDKFVFDMVLFGNPIDLIPLVIYSLQRGLDRGIGHGDAALVAVYQLKDEELKKIYTEGSEEVLEFDRTVSLKKTFNPSCAVRLLTPLRVQRDGKILNSSELTANDFFSALLRRIDLICRTHDKPIEIPYDLLLEETAKVKMTKTLEFRDWVRYSSRQKNKMNLPGLVGEIRFDDLSESLFRCLELAEFFHFGKNTAFGLGRIEIVES